MYVMTLFVLMSINDESYWDSAQYRAFLTVYIKNKKEKQGKSLSVESVKQT